MVIENLISIFQKIIDISIVWLILYFILKNMRKNVKMTLLFKGICIIILLKIFSDLFDLVTVGLLLEYLIMWGPLALIIVFQPEIRNVLEHLGRSQLLGRHKILSMDERERVVYELMNAIEYLKKYRIGALIVLERDNSLNEYIERSKKIYAQISADLLISIFFPRNPLHDGAVIIQGDMITSASAVFPVSVSGKINKRLGTRHRAALGIAEENDCLAIVISEETGRVSMAYDGELQYNLSLDDVRMLLVEGLNPKNDIFTDEEEVLEEVIINEKED